MVCTHSPKNPLVAQYQYSCWFAMSWAWWGSMCVSEGSGGIGTDSPGEEHVRKQI